MLNEAICVQNQTKIEKNVETEKSDVALFKMFDGVCPTNSISSTRGKQKIKEILYKSYNRFNENRSKLYNLQKYISYFIIKTYS